MQDRLKYRVLDKRNNNYLKNFVFNFINKAPYITIEYFDNEYAYTHTFEENEIIVEQCTGLKDKNGKLIYEGDILKITDQGIDDIVKVYWENGMYCFSISPNSANLVFSDLSDNETTCEIIGNIHKNADLLGEE